MYSVLKTADLLQTQVEHGEKNLLIDQYSVLTDANLGKLQPLLTTILKILLILPEQRFNDSLTKYTNLLAREILHIKHSCTFYNTTMDTHFD